MSKVLAQVALTVFGESLLVGLMGVGYLAQTFGPAQFNEPAPRRNQARSNYAYANEGPRYSNEPMERKPIPKGESVWEDYPAEDLDNTKRLPDRPGNFEVVKKVGEFFEGIYGVQPNYKDVAYPFRQNGEFVTEGQTLENWDGKSWREGKARRNKLRQFNLVIHKLTMLEFSLGESAVANPEGYGNVKRLKEVFPEVRKHHPERCCLVLIRASAESLQSDKIEGNASDSDLILCYVKKDTGWKLVWFE